ncbi:hypothetical protein LSUE1_G000329 [Lachnellula suecica]|uniref:MARVEL domain-containing protein n=1 Tax=Lachnellula suecica TaxID=602035 RepID=A0A8T9CH10_9HELO|nr:hypothetical protein LSUE1_G000329 [Lachnellula suecica]
MIVTLAVRVLQLVFAVIVLALSIVLIRGMGPAFFGETASKAPSLIDYGAFCGGAGIAIAIVGVVAAFLEPLQGIIIIALDGLASFFLLAGGIAFAATIKVGDCGDTSNNGYLGQHAKTFEPSDVKNYGYTRDDKSLGKWEKDFINDTSSRCRMIQAETAFIWFMFAGFLATTALSFMNRSRGGGRATMV